MEENIKIFSYFINIMQIKRKLQNKAFVKKFECYNQKSLG